MLGFVFAGMSAPTLLAIFGAVGGAVLVLYILKLRRRVVAVPFSPLWQRILRDKEATSLFSRLKRLLSLLLQLALLALLVLALGDPRLPESLLKGRSYVVLIDASASMQAIDGASKMGEQTRLGAAKERARELIRKLNGADRMLIAQMDAMVTPLGPMSDDTSELERMLDQVKPTETRADFPRALRFAKDALGDALARSDRAEIVILSDGNLGEAKDGAGTVRFTRGENNEIEGVCDSDLDEDAKENAHCVKLSYVPFGKSDVNVAITQFSVRRYPLDKSRYEVMLEVRNTTPFLPPTDEDRALRDDIAALNARLSGSEAAIDKETDADKKKVLLKAKRALEDERAPLLAKQEELEKPFKEDQAIDVELSLFGDGQLVDVTSLKAKPSDPLDIQSGNAASALPRFYPNLSGASRTLEARIRPLSTEETKQDVLPVDDHAYALLPERRRAKVLVVSEGNTYLQAALLLDEYLEVTDVKPQKYPDEVKRAKYDVVIFDTATPADAPNAHALYLDPRGPGSPVKSTDELVAEPKKNRAGPGFDKIDRKHPIIRYTALDDVNVSAAHKLVPERDDKVVGASDEGASPILVAGTRKGNKFVALGFDVRDSDLPLRMAWPLFLINTINWFMDEDAKYLSSYRTGDVWRIAVAGQAKQATLKLPDGESQSVPIHEGRAVYLGERAGFYELNVDQGDAPSPDPSATPGTTAFAANLLDEVESTVGPVRDDQSVRAKKDGRAVSLRERVGLALGTHQKPKDGEIRPIEFEDPTEKKLGVRRETWIYLLLIAALVTAIEWATYHRRLTV